MLWTSLLTALCLALVPQDLEQIEKTLKQAVDKSTYERGAYPAARKLAELQGPEAMAVRLDLFDSKLSTYRGVYLRDWFYTGMCRAETEAETALLVKAAADRKRSELQRVLCLRALVYKDSRDSARDCKAPVPAKALLDKSFRKAPERVRREWQRSLGMLFREDRLLAKGRDADKLPRQVHDLLIDAGMPFTGLGAMPEVNLQDCATILEGLAKSKDAGDKAEAMRFLATVGPEDFFLEAFEICLRDKHRALRFAALDAARERRLPVTVPLLIQALEVESQGSRGRFLYDCGDALMAITGQRFGYGPELWKRWWESEGESFLSQGPPEAAQSEVTPEDETTAKLFGLPIRSQRVCVLVDGSGSMNEGDIGGKTPAEAAASELESFLQALDKDAQFNVILIDTDPKALFKKLMPAAKGTHQRKAVDHLRKFNYRTASALVDALRLAQVDPAVDTLVLISDGGSSAGIHQYGGHILADAKREFARTGVRIHGICVGNDKTKIRFMRDLAEQTGGTMIQPRE